MLYSQLLNCIVFKLLIINNKRLRTRGLSHNIELTLSEFESLYKDSSIIEKQNKWFKDIYKGTIKIEKLPYNIKYTENKRHLILMILES